MKSKIFVTGVLLFFGALRTHAQTVITLQDALKYALANSEAIKKAQYDIENGLNVVKETRAGAKPQLNATSTVTLNPVVQQFVLPAEAFGGTPGEFIAIKAGQTWNGMTQVQVSQQLYNQQLFTGLKAAKGSAEFYSLMKELSEENVVQQVATNYYQVLVNQHKLGLIEDNLERVKKLESVLQGLVDNGLGKKIDVDRVKVNKVNLETQKTQLLNAIDLQKNVLKYSMSMPISEPIELHTEDLQKLETLAASLNISPEVDVESLLNIKVLRKQEELLGLNRDAMRADFYPRASLSGQWIQNTQSNKFNLYTGNALNYSMLNFTLNINIPIYDGGAKRARLDQAKVDLLKQKEEIKGTSNALKMAYESAKIQMKNSLESIHNQKANLELAQEVYDNINNNYRLGLANLTDLLNAEAELTSTQNAYSDALLQFKVAEIELMKARGEIKNLAIN